MPRKRRSRKLTTPKCKSSTTSKTAIMNKPLTSSRIPTTSHILTTRLSKPKGWTDMPPELRRMVYDLVIGEEQVDCCGCATTRCEEECVERHTTSCSVPDEIPTIVNPRMNLMLVNKAMSEDIQRIPQKLLIGIYHGCECVKNRLKLSTPTFLRSLSQIRCRGNTIIKADQLDMTLRALSSPPPPGLFLKFQYDLMPFYEEISTPYIVFRQITERELTLMKTNDQHSDGEREKVRKEVIINNDLVFDVKGPRDKSTPSKLKLKLIRS